MSNELIVCNTDLHNTFGTDNSKFFNRIKHLKQMRTMPSAESFSYFITSDFELNRLKELQLGIKTGKIDFIDTSGRKSEYVFALDISKRIVDWLYNSSPKELEKQLVAWIAIMYFLDPDHRPVLDDQLHKRLLNNAKKLIQQRFTKYFNVTLSSDGIFKLGKKEFLDSNQVRLKYTQLCMEYFGKPPCYPLDNPWGFPSRTDHYEYGVIGARINFGYSFMFERDWNTIVLEGIRDTLDRAESTPHLIKDWKEVITKHEIHAHHIYDRYNEIPIKEYMTQKEGFVYLLSNVFYKDNLYKIGYTTRNVEDRVNELYTTGVPVQFDVEFRLPVNNLYKVEKAIHHKLKKHRINDEREFFLGEKDLFIKTIREYENLR